MQSQELDPKQNVVEYGQTLVVMLGGIEYLLPKVGWFESLLLRLLRAAYQRRLRALIEALPGDVRRQILEEFE